MLSEIRWVVFVFAALLLLLASAGEALAQTPTITSISPTSGVVGTQITITGTGFGTTAGTASVNWTNATIQSWNDTQVVITVAPGSTTGGVRVVSGGATSNAVTFTMPNPQITSISPTSGVVGTQITITGTGFGATQGTASVNWRNAAIQSWSDTQVVITVAPGTTTGGVRVVNGGVTSNAVTFTLPNPQITSISPTTGVIGTEITITGTDFGVTAGTASVNWKNATIQSWSDTQVVVNVAPGTTTGGVRVVNGGVTSNAVTFTLPNPQIASISPTSGGVGTQITITGTGFGVGGTASVNWTNATVQSWSDTQIVATVSSGTTTGGVRVVNGGVTSNAVTFTMPNPQITSISPTSGAVGTQITITGTGFGTTAGTASVNWTNATVQSWSDTQIVATVNSGTTTGGVRVVNGGVTSNAVTFTMPNPQITSISPTSGLVGTQITITGTGFGATAGTASVNWTNATIQSWSDTQIVATVSSGTTTGGVRVVNGGVTSNAVTFTLPNPQITSISPASGTVGAQITITGTGFGATAGTASVNWTNATIQSWSDTQIVATVSAGTTTGGVRVVNGGVTSNAATFTVLVPGGFVGAGNMTVARDGDTATLLTNGIVLIAGGYDANNKVLSSAELYDPTSGSFSATGNMTTPRADQTATLLNDGTVLIAGGYDQNSIPLGSAEIYNPATGTFTPTGSMSTARAFHTATLLDDGTVLIAGGYDNAFNALASAELYNPATGSFTSVGSMVNGRVYHTATLLTDGRVLIVGGDDTNGNVLGSAELYDPATQTFTATGSLNVARDSQTATLLNDGLVLIAGGEDSNYYPEASAELFDPSTGTFLLTGSMIAARIGQSATLLSNGTVLIAGGTDSSYASLASAEIYDPATETFSTSGNLNASRSGQTATLLNNGTVLLAGGFESSGSVDPTLASAEVYQPASTALPNLISIAVAPAAPSIAAGTAQPFVATGTFSDNSTEVLSSVVWNSSDNAVATVTNDSTNRGAAFGAAAGSATLTACAGSVCGSTTLTVSAGALAISGLSPSAGTVGTPVIIGGTGFGASQGNSTVTFNGTPATVQLWSATGVVVTVPSGATTGDVVVTVGGAGSNGVLFTVSPSPVITGLSPTEGFAGAAVTISGANFGASQGSSAVTFNGLPATATSWSDTSIAVTVPAGATTGYVVVAVSGVPSNGVEFGVPVINAITPTSGPAGTLVTIIGSGFGATQGSGVAAINGIPMQVVNWNDTEIQAAVANGTTTGTVSVQQGSIAISGPTFTVSASPAGGTGPYPISGMEQSYGYTVSPETLSLLVGQSRTISVTDGNGNPVTVQWLSTDSSVVSLSSDNPPVLTGVAPGSATVYAGDVPVPVTVYAGTSLPPGTVNWSVGVNASGPGEVSVVPAVPSSTGADAFVLDASGTLSALTSDGSLAWSAPGIGSTGSEYGQQVLMTSVIPDFSGGALLKTSDAVSGSAALARYDPSAGQTTQLYTFSGALPIQSAISDTTGVLFIQDDTTIVVMKLSTGEQIASINLENLGSGVPSAEVGKMIVAGDGNAYIPYDTSDATGTSNCVSGACSSSTQYTGNLRLLRVAPDGSYANVDLGDNWTLTENCTTNPDGSGECTRSASGNDFELPSVITNADTGVAVFGVGGGQNYCANSSWPSLADGGQAAGSSTNCTNPATTVQLTLVSSDGAITAQNDDVYTITDGAGDFAPVLQRADGSFIAAHEGTVVAVGPGGELWEQQLAPLGFPVSPLYATADGGVVVTTTQPKCAPGDIESEGGLQGGTVYYCASGGLLPSDPGYGQLGTLYALDQNGNITSQTPDTGAAPSWTNQWYLDPTNTVSAVSDPPIDFASTWAAITGGNHSGTSASVQQEWYPPLPSCNDPHQQPPISCPGPQEAMLSTLTELRAFVSTDCSQGSKCDTAVFAKLHSFLQGFGSDQTAFFNFLGRKPGLYDITRSNMPSKYMCNWFGWNGFSLDGYSCSDIRNRETVSQEFYRYLAKNLDIAAMSQMPAKNGILIFFHPSDICTDSSQDSKFFNEALLWHESLHGFYGYGDSTIQNDFGINESGITNNITWYIQQNVFGEAGQEPIQCGN